MRHVSIFITAAVLLACAACGQLFGPDTTTIQVQGQVTAADDGSPIPFALVLARHRHGCFIECSWERITEVQTDTQGNYSLSYSHGSCGEGVFFLTVITQHSDFKTVGVTCTEKLQTIDIQF